MFRRKVEGLLVAWKETPQKTPLLIRGLRRSGKKTVAMVFAQSSYRNFCVLDMEAEPSLHRSFFESLDPSQILSRLSLVRPDVRVTPGDSVLVLGEIQDCARARASLRYFRESGKYDVVATSSFADIGDYNRDPGLSIPVGSERYIHMLPLDFEEFLWAMGHEALSNEIRSSLLSLSPLPELVHEKAEGLYRSFLVAGGMPEAVEGFLHGGYSASQKACRALMDAYKDDFGRYIGKDGKPDMDGVLFAKIRKAVASITEQIADEKGAFAYSRIGNGARRRSFENALDWLGGYGLVYRCRLLKRISTPLLAHEDDETFKLYIADTGLLLSLFDEGIRREAIGEIYRGAAYENAVAAALHSNGFPLRYYKRRSGLEIDFVISLGGRPVLLEAKARGGRSKSLSTVLADKKTYGDENIRAIKLTSAPLSASQDGETIRMPHYCLPYLTPDMDLFG